MQKEKPKKRMSQNDMVLKHLKDFGSITTFEAFSDYGITRLSARIADLKKKYAIISESEVRKNRYGVEVNYVRYRLAEEGDLT